MKYLDCCITATKVYCKKSGHYKEQTYVIDVDRQYYHRNISSKWVDLAYDTSIDHISPFYLKYSYWTLNNFINLYS